MKKIILMIFLCLLALTGCSKQDPFRVGFSSTLSGDGSDLGIGLRNGLTIKIDEINEAGGINGRLLELVIKDDEGNLDKVREVDQSFIDEGIVLFVGHDISGKIIPILETIEGQEIIAVSGTIATQYASDKVDNFYRTMTSNAAQGIVMAELIKGQDGSTIIIYDEKNREYGDGLIKQFDSVYDGRILKYGLKTTVLQEINSIAHLLMDEAYDNVISITNPEDTVNLYKYIQNEDLDLLFMTSNWGVVGNDFSEYGNDLDGLICTIIGEISTTAAIESFNAKYLERFGEEASIAAVYAYEAGTYIEEVLRDAKGWDYASLTQAFRQPRQINGLVTTIDINEYGDADRGTYLFVVREGQLIKME